MVSNTSQVFIHRLMTRNPCRPPFIQCPGVVPLNQVLVHPIMWIYATYGSLSSRCHLQTMLVLSKLLTACCQWTIQKSLFKSPWTFIKLHFLSSGCGILFDTRHMSERCPVIMVSAVCFPWWKWV